MREEQERWINIQANAAVERAMKDDSGYREHWMAEAIKRIDSNFDALPYPELETEYLIYVREKTIAAASDSLIEAELLHREIVRRGGHV